MKTTWTMRVANLTCPSCDVIQPHTRLTRTMHGDDNKIEYLRCGHCSIKLRIKRGRGLVQTGILIIGMFTAVWLTGVQKYNGSIEFGDIERAAFVEGVIRIGIFLIIMASVVFPISARILKVEEVT
ncbi:MAG: hypothetical protein OSA49_04200 [Ascidiaceihabitans sp.]|nr:hypothetical protein [Ascidiaceihabitans sp.]